MLLLISSRCVFLSPTPSALWQDSHCSLTRLHAGRAQGPYHMHRPFETARIQLLTQAKALIIAYSILTRYIHSGNAHILHKRRNKLNCEDNWNSFWIQRRRWPTCRFGVISADYLTFPRELIRDLHPNAYMKGLFTD